jgi:hypothetical protein
VTSLADILRAASNLATRYGARSIAAGPNLSLEVGLRSSTVRSSMQGGRIKSRYGHGHGCAHCQNQPLWLLRLT